MPFDITPIYAGLLGLLLLVLATRVILHRRSSLISLGSKDDTVLERRIRGHGNFTEYVPTALILLAAFELQGGAGWAVHALGMALLIGRILHGYAFGFTTYSPLRVPGMAITLMTIGILSIANIVMAV